ncbi:MAG: heme ABC transporter ATP-binding protein [Litoreibacter sp.]
MSLEARDIGVVLGKAQILQDLDFTAKPGELTAIVGPNGCGKTTLLRALTGDVAYRGTVRVNGADVSRLKPWELASMRGVLPQATTLSFPFTVIEVVRIGLQSGRSADQEHLARRALERVNLGSYANRFYQELSGGEQQRTQLARVLTQVWQPMQDNQPRWLLLDEPVSSLDIGHQLEVMDIMKTYAQAGGGVVAVMHDLNLTALYADNVAVMADGNILGTGTPQEVLTNRVLSRAYDCDLRVNQAPNPDATFVLPHAATRRDATF